MEVSFQLKQAKVLTFLHCTLLLLDCLFALGIWHSGVCGKRNPRYLNTEVKRIYQDIWRHKALD